MKIVRLNKSVPVTFTVRLTEGLKEALGKESAKTGISMNGLIIQYLEDGLRHAQIHRTEYRNPR
jgi:hypothetical protein